MTVFNFIKVLFTKLLSLLNSLRLFFVNSIFYLIVLVVIIASMSGEDEIEIPENTALVLNLSGSIVEQKVHVDPVDSFFNELSSENNQSSEILLTDIVNTIKHAKTDDNINTLVLKLKDLKRSGLTKMRIIGKALVDFKTSGKQIIAIGDSYSQEQYYLASYANEIWLNPQGWLLLDGYGRYQMYYKSAFEKLNVSQHIFRVGTFKSAVEPYMRDNMSEQAKQANQEWLMDLWSLYKNDVAEQRGFSISNFDEDAEVLLKKLSEANGKIAQYAVNNQWVDKLKTREQMTNAIKEIVGENKDGGFNRINFSRYLTSITPPFVLDNPIKDTVAVVVAQGTILDGKQPAGSIGGDSTAALLRKARKDDKVKAVVLRVDSPGGSAYASEIIRQEVELLKNAGKPVVASMGTYAASGGYWISASANKIYASPTTITGSIGIFGLFMTFEKTLAKLGIYTDGVGTSDFAGLTVTRALPETMGDIFQLAINRGYQDFISLVATNRNMSLAQVDKIAQGRVWSGSRAKELGLVDELGGLDDAIKAVAEIAGLEHYQTKVIEKELSAREKFIKEMLNDVSVWMPNSQFTQSSIISKLLTTIEKEFGTLEQLNDPQGMYALCLPCQPM